MYKSTCTKCGNRIRFKDEKLRRCRNCDEPILDEELNPSLTSGSPAVGQVGWGAATGAGFFGGAITGFLAANTEGQLRMGAFVLYLIFIAPIQPWSRRIVAMIVFPAVAALVVVLNRN